MVGLHKTLSATGDMVAPDFHRELLKSGVTTMQTVCYRKRSCIRKYPQSYQCQLEFSKVAGI